MRVNWRIEERIARRGGREERVQKGAIRVAVALGCRTVLAAKSHSPKTQKNRLYILFQSQSRTGLPFYCTSSLFITARQKVNRPSKKDRTQQTADPRGRPEIVEMSHGKDANSGMENGVWPPRWREGEAPVAGLRGKRRGKDGSRRRGAAGRTTTIPKGDKVSSETQ